MKVAVVTGGAGFVGSHLCARLYREGFEVYSVDNYFTGSVKNHIPGVNYIKGKAEDIGHLLNCSPVLVFHLGEYSRVEQSFDDIDIVWDYNIKGILSILHFCKAHNSKLIYAGSSTKFGDGGIGRSQSPYAWSKSTNTDLVVNYANWFELNYAITYFYNVYGDREIEEGKYATLIALFKNKMKNNEALTVVSPGSQRRNFTHVEDIVEGLMLVAEHGAGDGYGIGSDASYSVLEIAEMFGGEIKMLAERAGNRQSASVVSEKLAKLGWKTKHSVEDYINDCKKGRDK